MCAGARLFCFLNPDIYVKVGSLPAECPRKSPDERTKAILKKQPDLEAIEDDRERTITTRWIDAEKEHPPVRDDLCIDGWKWSDVVLVWAIRDGKEGQYGLGQWAENIGLGEAGWTGATADDYELDERFVKVTHWVPLPDRPGDWQMVD